jgi:ribosomal protein L24E
MAEQACAHCGRTFEVRPNGRPRKYCKPSCRSMASEKRNPRGPKATRVPMTEQIARRVWEGLQAAELVPADKPLPPARKVDVS